MTDGEENHRLREALRMAGGRMTGAREHADHWVVSWTGRSGEAHASAIAKSDLTVLSTGICLGERDRDFDLHSLVGVCDGAWD